MHSNEILKNQSNCKSPENDVYWKQEMMSVTDVFNFEMTTKYMPEFKNLITYKNLYKILARECTANKGMKFESDKEYTDFIEDETFRIRDMITGKDKSSIKSKLKNQQRLKLPKTAKVL